MAKATSSKQIKDSIVDTSEAVQPHRPEDGHIPHRGKFGDTVSFGLVNRAMKNRSITASRPSRTRTIDQVDPSSSCSAGPPSKKRKTKGTSLSTSSAQLQVDDTNITNSALLEQSAWTDDTTATTAAIASAGTHRYSKKWPEFWNGTLSTRPDRLYPVVVSAGSFFADPPPAPVLILTTKPLPTLSKFRVFSSSAATVVELCNAGPLDLNGDQLAMLHGYTIRVCRALTNKALATPLESMPYLFAPLDRAWERRDAAHLDIRPISDYIPWDLVRLAAHDFMIPFLPDGFGDVDSIAQDAIVQDRRVEFTNRFFVDVVRQDLTPLSKAEDSPREAEYGSFLEYCRARIKDFPGLKNERQHLIQVSVVPGPVNYLNPISKPLPQASKAPAKYLIPELCAKFTLPASTFRTMLLLPSVLRRIDDQLLVKEANVKFFHKAIRENHLIAALTPPAASVEFDYERLELFGDSFLKYVASTYCFVTMPSVREGALHIARQNIISNKALLQGATKAGLPPYIQSKPFVAKSWQPIFPPSPMDDGQGSGPVRTPTKKSKKQRQQDEQHIQWLGDKTVADVVEAIIGAAYLSGGRQVALSVMRTLNVNVDDVEQWSDFTRKAVHIPKIMMHISPHTQHSVEEILGGRFKKPELLAQALTHHSVEARGHSGYDRLEFVGDAVLDFLVVRFIFDRHPTLSPGGLTLLKSAMVSNHALAAFCVHSGLHRHLRHAEPDLSTAIRTYVTKLEGLRRDEEHHADIQSRLPGQYWLGLDPPKILPDIVESIIGALYISDDFTEDSVMTFFERTLKPFYDRHIRLESLCAHPTSTLFELLQSYGCHQHGIIKERVQDNGEDCTRCEVIIHEIVVAEAEEATSSTAIWNVALYALDALDGDPDFMTRSCDCRVSQQSRKGKQIQRAQLGYEDDGFVLDQSRF